MANRAKWEYRRLVEEISGRADVQGAIDARVFDLIQAAGAEGWELVAAQHGTRPHQEASNAVTQVMVLLFKRELLPQ